MGDRRRSELWIQLPGRLDDGNHHEAFDMFLPEGEALWERVLARTSWIIVRATSFRRGMFAPDHPKAPAGFLSDVFLPFVRRRGIKLAVNCTSAGRAQCGRRWRLLPDEIAIMERIRSAGGTIDALRFQSLYSGTIRRGDCMDLYPKGGALDLRAEDLVRAVRGLREVAPEALIVIADTGAAKTDDRHRHPWNYKLAYSLFYDAVKVSGLGRVFAFHLAWTLEEIENIDQVAEAARFLREDLGVGFGFTYASDLGRVSDEDYRFGMMMGARLLRYGEVNPDHAIVTSWMAHPKSLLPETNDLSFTGVARSMLDVIQTVNPRR